MDVAAFPKVQVDILDKSRVKFFKFNGVFLPQNKYSKRKSVSKSGNSRRNLKCSIEYRTLTLPEFTSFERSQADSSLSTAASPTSGKWSATSGKRSHVTWSGIERGDHCETETAQRKKSNNVIQENSSNMIRNETMQKASLLSAKSSKSWPGTNIKTANRKIEMSFQWRLPPTIKREETFIKKQSPRPMSDCTNMRSKNLTPVASGLERTGMSERRIRWNAWDVKLPSDLDINRDWQNIIQKIKDPPIKKFRQFQYI